MCARLDKAGPEGSWCCWGGFAVHAQQKFQQSNASRTTTRLSLRSVWCLQSRPPRGMHAAKMVSPALKTVSSRVEGHLLPLAVPFAPARYAVPCPACETTSVALHLTAHGILQPTLAAFLLSVCSLSRAAAVTQQPRSSPYKEPYISHHNCAAETPLSPISKNTLLTRNPSGRARPFSTALVCSLLQHSHLPPKPQKAAGCLPQRSMLRKLLSWGEGRIHSSHARSGMRLALAGRHLLGLDQHWACKRGGPGVLGGGCRCLRRQHVHGRRHIGAQALGQRQACPQRSHVGAGACAHIARLCTIPAATMRALLGGQHSEPGYQAHPSKPGIADLPLASPQRGAPQRMLPM